MLCEHFISDLDWNIELEVCILFKLYCASCNVQNCSIVPIEVLDKGSFVPDKAVLGCLNC